MQDQRLEWLKSKMDSLFETKEKVEAAGRNFNTSIQAGREYRNPRICEKLIERCDIKQYGTNFSKEQFDPECWRQKPDSFYDSRLYRKMAERREREKHQQRHHHNHHGDR